MFSSPEEAGEIVVSSGLFPAFIALLLGITNLAYTWWARNQTVAADKVAKLEARVDLAASAAGLKALEDRVDKVEDRQISVEEQMKHLPTKEDIAGLRIQLAETLGLIGRQGAEITSMSHAVNRMDTYLMREKA